MRGYTKTRTGFRAWVRVASKRDAFNELVTKRFPATADAVAIRAWRAEATARLKLRLEQHRQRLVSINGDPGTFRADAARYLLAIAAMTTYTERARDIALWIVEFGDRPRASIEPHEIRAVRDRWLTIGPKCRWQKVNGVGQWVDVAEPLSASTVNHRLRALSNLWTVLDGRHAPNPVRDHVPEADEPAEVPRAIDYQTIRLILDAMPDRGRAEKKGVARPTFSSSKLCARCLAWSGITPVELLAIIKAERATPGSYVHLDDELLVVPPRRKGRGAPGRIVPLGPDGLAAFQDLIRLIAEVRFSGRATLRAWHRSSLEVLGRRVRLYDLRHSFVTGIVRATKNLNTAQMLAGHADPRTTRRYALAALLPMLRAGMEAFSTDTAEKEESQ